MAVGIRATASQALPLHGKDKLVMRAYDPEAREEKAADGERTTAEA
jgi:hypothetical protein